MKPLTQVTVVGLGLIGGSIAKGIALALPGVKVTGIDTDPGTVKAALNDGTIHAGDTSLNVTFVQESPLVVVAVPAPAALDVLGEVSERMAPGSVLTDTVGSKCLIAETARRTVKPGVHFVGGHPMAGKEKSGYEVSQPDLFQGARVVICAEPGAPGTEVVGQLWQALGGMLVFSSASEHDLAVTYASHLPYLAAAAVASEMMAVQNPLAQQMAAGGFRDVTRMAADPTVALAALQNQYFIQGARALAKRLDQWASALENGTPELLGELQAAGDYRRLIGPQLP